MLKLGREVAGVVTEADLLAAKAKTASRLQSTHRLGRRHRTGQHPALTAGALMTSPAITIAPHVTVHAAGRVMSDGAHGDLIPVAIRLMWDVDGVVDIIDRLGQSQPPTSVPITERQAR